MARAKDQHKAGIPPKPRGQQTGFAGNPDQNREEMRKTPALRGRRKRANKMFGDASEQHVAGPRPNNFLGFVSVSVMLASDTDLINRAQAEDFDAFGMGGERYARRIH